MGLARRPPSDALFAHCKECCRTNIVLRCTRDGWQWYCYICEQSSPSYSTQAEADQYDGVEYQ